MTAFKTRPDVVSVPPKLIFEPTLEGFVFLFTERAIAAAEPHHRSCRKQPKPAN